MKSVALIGASGLVGGEVLDLLVKREGIEQIHLLSRRSLGHPDPRIREYLGDLTQEDYYGFEAEVDTILICVGTTRSKTPDLNAYKKVDLGIPYMATQWALQHGASKVGVISSMGANVNSKIFYNHIKGSMERELERLEPNQLLILRPSIILGDRDEFRFGESMGKFLIRLFGPLMPAKYRAIEADTIARVLVGSLAKQTEKREILESDSIKTRAKDLL